MQISKNSEFDQYISVATHTRYWRLEFLLSDDWKNSKKIEYIAKDEEQKHQKIYWRRKIFNLISGQLQCH